MTQFIIFEVEDEVFDQIQETAKDNEAFCIREERQGYRMVHVIDRRDWQEIKAAIDRMTGRLIYQTADLLIDISQRTIFKDGKQFVGGEEIFYVLDIFLHHPQRVLNRETLITMIEARSKNEIYDNTLSVSIYRLRRLLGTYNGKPYIRTVPKSGYMWIYEVKKSRI